MVPYPELTLSRDCETYFYSERMERAEMTENEIILYDYLREIEKYYKLGIAKEHTYRSTLQTMLPRLVQGVTAVNEPKRVACGAPDYALLRSTARSSLTIGNTEAKAIGVSLEK